MDYQKIYQTLLQAPYYDVDNLCQTDKTAQQICNNDQFWQEKLQLEFDYSAVLQVNQTYKQLYDQRAQLNDYDLYFLYSRFDEYFDLNVDPKDVIKLGKNSFQTKDGTVYVTPNERAEKEEMRKRLKIFTDVD